MGNYQPTFIQELSISHDQEIQQSHRGDIDLRSSKSFHNPMTARFYNVRRDISRGQKLVTVNLWLEIKIQHLAQVAEYSSFQDTTSRLMKPISFIKAYLAEI